MIGELASHDVKIDAKPPRPSCPICQECFALATTTPCCHRSFCYGCIRSWLQKHSTKGSCPRCRAPVTLRDLRPNPDLDDMVAALGLLEPDRVKELEAFRKMRTDDGNESTQKRTQTAARGYAARPLSAG